MNIEPYLRLMAQKGASDLFFTTGAPISMKVQGVMKPVSRTPLEPGLTKRIAYAMLDEEKRHLFDIDKEMNLGVSLQGVGRYRVNVYQQRGEISIVIRYIKSQIPSLEELHLPPVLKDLVMSNTGLIMIVGATGSGKSTSMAAMIDYRSMNQAGHILTVEDPIEYVFSHKKSIVGQREVGIDTLNYANALREAMRQAPNLIMIGEVRDRHTMEAAIGFADTGHLAMSTLHAVNANQALDRIINMFPPEAKNQILMDLSMNLKGIVSQRLVVTKDGTRIPAVEVLINTPYITELIRKGEIGGIKEIMEKGGAVGMQTFDQSLFELYKTGQITLQEALNSADSRGDLEWKINFGGGLKALNKGADSLQFPSDVIDQPSGASADPEEAEDDDEDEDNDSGAVDDLKPLSETMRDDED
ncbi:MAG: PilT/PilU family type 4a pilus ATPase [Gammaproteobacteria bacterium]|jgi:twitching motility protein PilU